MNIKQAKQIPIQTLLEKRWFKPMKTSRGAIWFLSPFRDERTPSFKVNTELNTRYDFGLWSGGDGIKLIVDLHATTVSGALQILDSVTLPSPVTHKPQAKLFTETQFSTLKLLNLQKLSYFPLLQYLKQRRISVSVAQQYCTQLHFQNKNGKEQIAIGFRNDADSFEVRNRLFKGFIGDTKTISCIDIEHGKELYLFEGFFDFLAFQTKVKDEPITGGFIILNGVQWAQDAIRKINALSPSLIHCYLDNDAAGRKVFETIEQSVVSSPVHDHSSEYGEVKDFSQYWEIATSQF